MRIMKVILNSASYLKAKQRPRTVGSELMCLEQLSLSEEENGRDLSSLEQKCHSQVHTTTLNQKV